VDGRLHTNDLHATVRALLGLQHKRKHIRFLFSLCTIPYP
jgi:hypothetical protein